LGTKDWTVLFSTEEGGGDVVWQYSGSVTAFMPPVARTVPGAVSPAASSESAVQIKASWHCG